MMGKTELQTEIARRKAVDVAYLLLSDEQIAKEILEERESAQKKAKADEEQKKNGDRPKSSVNLTTARRDWFQNWYAKLGFTISIPLPLVSDEEFKRRKVLDQALFYRPPTSEVSYKALMKVVGQDEHWTVVDNDDKKIIGEPTKKGYWFWAEVAQNCPRLGTSWNTLVLEQKLNLLSLEEYVIVWWAYMADTNIMLDTRTWSWLRTRFGQGALDAHEYRGFIDVYRWLADDLEDSYGSGGGRAAEVVQT